MQRKSELSFIISSIKLELKSNYSESPFIVFISGVGGSGKSTFAKLLQSQLYDCSILNLDNYKFSRDERIKSGLLGSNPEANKISLIIEHLKKIKLVEEFDKPVYNEISGSANETEKFTPCKYNLIEGELCLDKDLIPFADYIILIESSILNLFYKRMQRDILKRKYGLYKSLKVFWQSNILDYNKFYKPNIHKVNLVVKLTSKNEIIISRRVK